MNERKKNDFDESDIIAHRAVLHINMKGIPEP